MKTEGSSKVLMLKDSHEQQENIKNTRKTLKVIQPAASDKENLVGRIREKEIKLNFETAKTKLINKETQTDAVITAEDLTSDNPGVDYWRRLAEKRGEDLNESLKENEKLKEDIVALQEENKICKVMLEESKALVEVLQEMLEDEPNEDTTTELSEEV